MVLFNIYTDVLERTYRAHVCSFATVFFICIGILTYVGPLFIAYHSIGFWLKEDHFREQPEVNYKHDFIIYVQGSSVDSVLGYSTFPKLNKLLGESLRIPTVTSAEFDANHDGKNDYLTFQIKLPLSDTEVINHVQLLLFFGYQLHTHPSVKMQSLAYIEYDSPLPGSDFITIGDLKLNQKNPLPHKGSYTKFNVPIIDVTSESLKTWDLQNIMSLYQARNLTTDFIARYPVWKAGQTFGNPFTINVKVFYPEEVISYRPGIWQLLKHAWIQYLAILLVFLVILGLVKRFVYTNRLITIIKQKVHID